MPTAPSGKLAVVTFAVSLPPRSSCGLKRLWNTSRSLRKAVSEKAPASPAMAHMPNWFTVFTSALAPARNPPHHHRGDREYPAAGSFRRACVARPALRSGHPGWRFRDLPRGEPALRGHQVRRSRARPGQHGRGSDQFGYESRKAAAGLSPGVGRRIRIAEALPEAAGTHHSAHAPGDLPDFVYHVFIHEMGQPHPDYSRHGADWRDFSALPDRNEFQRVFRGWIPGALWSLRADGRDHAGVHQSARSEEG